MTNEPTLLDRAQLVVADRVEKMIAEGSADQIALKFAEKGIKAACHSPTACAIAVYLLAELDAELGACHNILVDVPGGTEMDDITLYGLMPGSSWRRGDAREVAFERGVLGQFAHNFDYHAYPELERKGPLG